MTATPRSVPIALTIAGSDSSGGAGIQADLKTFTAFGVYGASVITALTAQNTQGVRGVETVSPAFVIAQMDAVLEDLEVGAIKTGMLATAEIVTAISRRLAAGRRYPLVVDPVMVATSGDALIAPDAVEAVRSALLPLAALITPNLPEAARLLETRQAATDAEVAAQAKALHAFGCRAVLIKGGHGDGDAAVDYLYEGAAVQRFARPARRYAPHAWNRLHPVGRHHGLVGAGRATARGGGAGQDLRLAGAAGRPQPADRARLGSRGRPVRHPPVTAGVSFLQPVQYQLPGWPDSG